MLLLRLFIYSFLQSKMYRNIFLILCISITYLFFISSCKTQNTATTSTNSHSHFDRVFAEAGRFVVIGEKSQAIDMYKQALEYNKKSAACYYQLARLYDELGEYNASVNAISKAKEFNPKNKWYRLFAVRIFLNRNNTKQAISEYNELLKIYPNDLESLTSLAILYTATMKFNDALKIYERIEKQIGITGEISLAKFEVLRSQRNQEKAYKTLNELINFYPLETRYSLILAEYYTENQELDKAKKLYDNLLNQKRNVGLVRLSLSSYYKATKDFDQSFEELKLAFADNSLELEQKVRILLTNMNSWTGNALSDEEIRVLLALLVEVHSNEPAVHKIYAEFLINEKRYKEAQTELLVVLQNEKNDFSYWEKLMSVDEILRDYSALYQHSQEALQLFPTQPTTYLFNGYGAFMINKNKEALTSLDAGLKLVVDNLDLESQFYFYKGEVFNKEKRYSESDSAFEQCLKIFPNNTLVLNNYSYYLSLRKENLQKAEQMSKKSLELDSANINYLDTYAWILYCLAKYSDAKVFIEKAIRLGGNLDVNIVEHYGDILYKLGEKDEALRQWKLAQRLGTGSDFLKEKVEKGMLIE